MANEFDAETVSNAERGNPEEEEDEDPIRTNQDLTYNTHTDGVYVSLCVYVHFSCSGLL